MTPEDSFEEKHLWWYDPCNDESNTQSYNYLFRQIERDQRTIVEQSIYVTE